MKYLFWIFFAEYQENNSFYDIHKIKSVHAGIIIIHKRIILINRNYLQPNYKNLKMNFPDICLHLEIFNNSLWFVNTLSFLENNFLNPFCRLWNFMHIGVDTVKDFHLFGKNWLLNLMVWIIQPTFEDLHTEIVV